MPTPEDLNRIASSLNNLKANPDCPHGCKGVCERAQAGFRVVMYDDINTTDLQFPNCPEAFVVSELIRAGTEEGNG